jgi:hypothetical protein
MVEKYIESQEQRTKNKDKGQQTTEGEVRSSESEVKGRKTIQTFKPSNFQTFKLRFWWLWYGYRWWVALRAVIKLIKF